MSLHNPFAFILVQRLGIHTELSEEISSDALPAVMSWRL